MEITNIKNILGEWICYILKNTSNTDYKITYNGSTNNPIRRLRQHNGELVGGAKMTKKYGQSTWRIYAIISGFPDHKNCLQCEWIIKHPDGKRRTSPQYRTPLGRIIGLAKILKLNKWTNSSIIYNNTLNIKVWVENEYGHLFNDMPNNIKVYLKEPSFFDIY